MVNTVELSFLDVTNIKLLCNESCCPEFFKLCMLVKLKNRKYDSQIDKTSYGVTNICERCTPTEIVIIVEFTWWQDGTVVHDLLLQ